VLKIAFPYQEQINRAWQSIAFNPKYQYYNASDWWSYTVEIANNSWETIQMVSVDKYDHVLGFLGVQVDRVPNKVSNVGVINFGEVNLTFSKDFFQFLTELFTKHKFRKIEWYVVCGNPVEKMYDKIVQRYGGRIVGVRKQAVMILGELCDEKIYEIFRTDFESRCHHGKG